MTANGYAQGDAGEDSATSKFDPSRLLGVLLLERDTHSRLLGVLLLERDTHYVLVATPVFSAEGLGGTAGRR